MSHSLSHNVSAHNMRHCNHVTRLGKQVRRIADRRRRRQTPCLAQTPLTAEQIRIRSERESLQLSHARPERPPNRPHPRRREQLQAALNHLESKTRRAQSARLMASGGTVRIHRHIGEYRGFQIRRVVCAHRQPHQHRTPSETYPQYAPHLLQFRSILPPSTPQYPRHCAPVANDISPGCRRQIERVFIFALVRPLHCKPGMPSRESQNHRTRNPYRATAAP